MNFLSREAAVGGEGQQAASRTRARRLGREHCRSQWGVGVNHTPHVLELKHAEEGAERRFGVGGVGGIGGAVDAVGAVGSKWYGPVNPVRAPSPHLKGAY